MNTLHILIIVEIILIAMGTIMGFMIKFIHKDLERLADCHNNLTDVVKDICDSLEDAGIPGPEVSNVDSDEDE